MVGEAVDQAIDAALVVLHRRDDGDVSRMKADGRVEGRSAPAGPVETRGS